MNMPIAPAGEALNFLQDKKGHYIQPQGRLLKINKNFQKACRLSILCAFILLINAVVVYAQDKYNTEVPKDILILRSTKDYQTAVATAKQAASRLHKELDLRGLRPNRKIGLTMSKADCDEYDYPCYLARGDGNAENDDYISIEYSNAYKGFAKGYYIVVAALTDVKSTSMKAQLAAINKIYPDAYAKRTFIWFGCMH
jgi:hypothetical protein